MSLTKEGSQKQRLEKIQPINNAGLNTQYIVGEKSFASLMLDVCKNQRKIIPDLELLSFYP
jgi:hypothetical protein